MNKLITIFVLLMSSVFSTYAMDGKRSFSTYAVLTTPSRTSSAPQEIPNATTQQDEAIFSRTNVLNRSASTPRAAAIRPEPDEARSKTCIASLSPRDEKHLHHLMQHPNSEASTPTDSSTPSSRSRSRYSSHSFESGYNSDDSSYE